MMGWNPDAGWGWGTWLGMAVMMAVVWGAVIAAIVVVFRPGRSQDGGSPRSDRKPGQILAERYARGEIDEAEYRLRTDVLRTADHPRRHHPSDVAGA